MTYLLENPVPIAVGGVVLFTMAAIVYTSLRTTWSLVAVVLVTLLAIGALVLERWWLTPREQVQQSLRELLADVEADDLPAVLDGLSPAASTVRSDAQTLMPKFAIDKARVTGAVAVTLGPGDEPTSATATTRVLIEATLKQGGLRGLTFSDVTFDFERRGDRWLLAAYSVSEEWRKKAASLRR